MLHYYPRHVSSINMLRADCPLLTGVLCSPLQTATIPDAVRIQFVLLKMGNVNARNMSRIVV